MFDGVHDFIAFSKMTKFPCLVLKKRSNRLDGVAILELLGEWVFGQCDVRRFFVAQQGRLEKLEKTRGL